MSCKSLCLPNGASESDRTDSEDDMLSEDTRRNDALSQPFPRRRYPQAQPQPQAHPDPQAQPHPRRRYLRNDALSQPQQAHDALSPYPRSRYSRNDWRFTRSRYIRNDVRYYQQAHDALSPYPRSRYTRNDLRYYQQAHDALSPYPRSRYTRKDLRYYQQDNALQREIKDIHKQINHIESKMKVLQSEQRLASIRFDYIPFYDRTDICLWRLATPQSAKTQRVLDQILDKRASSQNLFVDMERGVEAWKNTIVSVSIILRSILSNYELESYKYTAYPLHAYDTMQHYAFEFQHSRTFVGSLQTKYYVLKWLSWEVELTILPRINFVQIWRQLRNIWNFLVVRDLFKMEDIVQINVNSQDQVEIEFMSKVIGLAAMNRAQLMLTNGNFLFLSNWIQVRPSINQ
eukprot:852378_1